ncbi:hypothetical protein ASPCAL11353 [Aspergillus calidoustus]|uniref:C2H2-type domain-containing protein n=1 Tax=Aspergillus calidoustus TaxID=454130 RepID=A0A0U5CE67_ASPCI|nr:hypothetical protein ASPCAL11353 [Aspergillus calidoustus]
MASLFNSSRSTLTGNAAPDYSENTFILPDFPVSLDFQPDRNAVNLLPTPYPESPLNGLDPMDVAFPPRINLGSVGQPAEVGPIHRPSSSLSHLGNPIIVRHPYAREPPTWNATFAPLDRQVQADERSTSRATGYMSEVVDQSMHSTPSERPSIFRAPAPLQIPDSFRCKWAGCRSSRQFHRVGDLIRHLRTIHISPTAFTCPETDCGKSFGRRDHLSEHVKRRHGG